MAEYFRVRELAVHGATIVVGVAESTQIFRFFYDGNQHKMELVTLDDLARETQVARSGFEAVQAIGRALDSNDRSVLRDMNSIAKAMLIDQA